MKKAFITKLKSLKKMMEFPGSPVVKTLLSWPRVQVRFPSRKHKSNKPSSMAKKKKREREREEFQSVNQHFNVDKRQLNNSFELLLFAMRQKIYCMHPNTYCLHVSH